MPCEPPPVWISVCICEEHMIRIMDSYSVTSLTFMYSITLCKHKQSLTGASSLFMAYRFHIHSSSTLILIIQRKKKPEGDDYKRHLYHHHHHPHWSVSSLNQMSSCDFTTLKRPCPGTAPRLRCQHASILWMRVASAKQFEHLLLFVSCFSPLSVILNVIFFICINYESKAIVFLYFKFKSNLLVINPTNKRKGLVLKIQSSKRCKRGKGKNI